MADDTILTLTHATNRDIDLLLVEELQCSPAFGEWLVQRVSGNDFERSSVTHSTRGMVAQMEQRFIKGRQRDGIVAAKLRGAYVGGKKQLDYDSV
ncbi:hypothetical protein [Neorhizobium sp. DAR64860/K0K1]|uniref:hypothetical protein n=1 Tax=Neorhizobium sp. DAR64860/K0K1 TaxID=3421955 RepID=UPI003D2B5A98